MPRVIAERTFFSTPELLSLGAPPHGFWALKPLFQAVGKSMIYGAPNDYKTWTMLELAIDYASGGDFLGVYPFETHGSALFMSVEGDQYQSAARLTMLMRGSAGINPNQVELTFGHDAMYLNENSGITAFDEILGDLKPRLVIIDPFRHFIPGCDENSSTEISRVTANLDILLKRHQFSLGIIHHADKKNLSARGSSALVGWLDSIVHFIAKRKQMLKGMDEPCDVIVMHHEKSRNGPYLDDILMVPVIRDTTNTGFYSVLEGPSTSDTPQAVDGAQKILHWWKIAGQYEFPEGFAIDTARAGAQVCAEKARAGLLFLQKRGLAELAKILRPKGVDGSLAQRDGWRITRSTTDYFRIMLATMKHYMEVGDPDYDMPLGMPLEDGDAT